MKSRKMHNKKNKTKKQRKMRFFAGGPKDYDLSQMEEGRIKGESEREREREYILDDMEQGKLPKKYLLDEIEREKEEDEKNKRIKLANIPFSAFAKKMETEKKIDTFRNWKDTQNLKYLDAVKNNNQYLKNNPESLRERESGKSITIYASIDPETGEPVASYKDPDIRPINLHGEKIEKIDDYGFYAHDFDGGKTKRKRKRNKRQKRKTRFRRSIPFRK